jgi:hypothetical protein
MALPFEYARACTTWVPFVSAVKNAAEHDVVMARRHVIVGISERYRSDADDISEPQKVPLSVNYDCGVFVTKLCPRIEVV